MLEAVKKIIKIKKTQQHQDRRNLEQYVFDAFCR
jgi:hypothetical protein